MNIVSGLATANGISSLLNSSRDALTETRTLGEPAREQGARRAERTPKVAGGQQTQRPVDGGAGSGRSQETSARKPSNDTRHEQFVEAIEVLRRDETQEPQDLTPERVEAFVDAADKEINESFVDDGLPTPVEPPLNDEPETSLNSDDVERTPQNDGIPGEVDPLFKPFEPSPLDDAVASTETVSEPSDTQDASSTTEPA